MKSTILCNKLKKLIIAMIVIAINVNTITVAFAQSNDNNIQENLSKQIGAIRISDKSTVDEYKNAITNIADGSRYSGRVWTDKSVYANDGVGNVKLDDKFNIEYDDDFLTVFSALSSNKTIKTPNVIDLMFIVDISGSMGKVDDNVQTDISKTPMKKTVDAINTSIKQILELDSKTRVGIAVYGSTSVVLLPLDNYTLLDETPLLQVTSMGEYGKNQGLHFNLTATAKSNTKNEIVTKYANNSGLSNNEYNNEKSTISNANILGTSGHREGDGTSNSPWQVGHITNHQAGLAVGLNELATAENTTFCDKYGQMHSNIPCVIHITDGQTSDLATIDENSNWYNVDPTKDLAYNTRKNDSSYYNVNQLSGEKMAVPMIFQTLMTASYYTSKVNNHYQKNARNVNINNAENIEVVNYSVYAADTHELSNLDETTRTIIESVCNPSNTFLSNSDNKLIKGDADLVGAYQLFENWKEGINVDNTYIGDYISITLNANKEQIANNEDGVTVDDVIKNIYYVDDGHFLSTGFDKLYDVIESVIKEQITIVDEVSWFDFELENKLSYVDPIGEYMQIKELKKMILFGQEYNIIADREPVQENLGDKEVIKQYYKVVSSNNEDLTITNSSYGDNASFKLSDIKIWNEITKNYNDEGEYINSSERLYINIPKVAIPIRLDSIYLDAQENVIDYKTNINTDYALPIRITYTVGISDEILRENVVDTSKISKEYMTNNMIQEDEKKYVNFFSNYYDKKIYDAEAQTTLGNAMVYFTPATKNAFYLFQKNAIIYKNSSGGDSNGEGILNETGGSVLVSDAVEDLNEIKDNETYYYIDEFFVPEENDKYKGKLIKYVVAQTGAELHGDNNENYLTYYDTVKGEEVQSKGENILVATKIGEKRISNVKKVASSKEENITGTATENFIQKYQTTEEGNEVESYLGNNGKIKIEAKENLPKENSDNTITLDNVLPKTGEKTRMLMLIMMIALDIICIFFYIRYRKYKDIA